MTLTQLLRRLHQKAERENAEQAIIGWQDASGLYTDLDAAGRPSDIKVTLIVNDTPTTQDIVQARGGGRVGGRRVLIKTDEHGIRYVAGAVPVITQAQTPNTSTTDNFVAQHGHSHHVAGADPVLVDALQILPGLAFTSSGTTVQVGRIDDDGTAHDTVYYVNGEARVLPAESDYDWSADAATIASGKQAWIAIVIDEATNVLTALVGADQSGLVPTLDKALIEAFDFTGVVPLVAIRADSGQTSAPALADYFDLRPFAGALWGTMSSFTAAADSGTPQAVADGQTFTIAGGTGIDSVASATRTITLNIDSTVATLTGSQVLTNKTVDGDTNTLLIATSDANVTTPPTDAELTTAFGARSDGFTAVLDDNAAATNAYLIVRKNSSWWYAALTKAT